MRRVWGNIQVKCRASTCARRAQIAHAGAVALGASFMPFSFPLASLAGCGLAGSGTGGSQLAGRRAVTFSPPHPSDSVQNYSAVSTSSYSDKMRDRSNDSSSLFGGHLRGTRCAILKCDGLNEQRGRQRCGGETSDGTRLGFTPQNRVPQAPVSLRCLL